MTLSVEALSRYQVIGHCCLRKINIDSVVVRAVANEPILRAYADIVVGFGSGSHETAVRRVLC